MRIGILLALILVTVGCHSPVAPSGLPGPTATVGASQPTPEAVVATSRVLEWPPDLWLEHDPSRPDVQVCRTLPRAYSRPDSAVVYWTVDYYTVVAPEVCPAEPIE